MNNFETEKGIHFVKFGAEWSGPCRAYDPILNKFTNDFINRVNVTKIDIDSNRETTLKYKIKGVPTTIIFKDGIKIDEMVGVISLDALKTKVEYVESL